MIDLAELESSSALPSPIPGMVMVPMRSGTMQAIVAELRAARKCEYILRDMTDAVEDQQYLDVEWQLARSALNAYELVTTGKITPKPPKEDEDE